jgi:uncharacterized protein
MLINTFCHVPGIGLQTERSLWSAGIHTWGALMECASGAFPLSARREKTIRPFIHRSRLHLQQGDARFFAELLPAEQHWRLFREFRSSVAYLDIETTGTGPPDDHITAIALYDGQTVRSYIHGRDLDRFERDLDRYGVIVSYNGKCFDVPFIRQNLRIPVDQVHIDLRYVLKSLGYGGGLKACERKLGIGRGDLDGVDGYFAVLLWDDYARNGNERALHTLLAYNALDVVNLERLMVIAYNMKLRETPFLPGHALPPPEPPEIPFESDSETIEGIRRRIFQYA